jgi:formiminoglutamase
MNFEFIPSTHAQLLTWTSVRDGETKLGQTLKIEISDKTRFLLLGIEESIGPQSNFGMPGSENGFLSFIKRFVNIQANQFMLGDEICFIGSIKQNREFTTIKNGRLAIEELDELVNQLLLNHCTDNIIPIIVGGGHNNAFPIAKALHSIKTSKIDIINLDPHADCRAIEGRHSGNPFSYGIKEGCIEKYSVLGLHMGYNSQFSMDFLKEKNCSHTFYDNYLSDRKQLYLDLKHEISTRNNPIGFEIDLDAIAFMPSSAFSPSGWTLDEARVYIQICAETENIAYLHLPEGAPNSNYEDKVVGKALSYLVYDFIRIQQSK